MSNAECRVSNGVSAGSDVVRVLAFDAEGLVCGEANRSPDGRWLCLSPGGRLVVRPCLNTANDLLRDSGECVRTRLLTAADVATLDAAAARGEPVEAPAPQLDHPPIPFCSPLAPRPQPLDELRMLTVYQPWASLLAGGVKKIETRSRAYAYKGLLFIHAGLFEDDTTTQVACLNRSQLGGLKYDILVHQWWKRLPRGCIVGAVRMARCMSTEDLIEAGRVDGMEKSLGDYGVDRFGWLMEDAVLFKNPIGCKGGQGPRFVPGPTAKRVMDELHASANEMQLASLLQVEQAAREVA